MTFSENLIFYTGFFQTGAVRTYMPKLESLALGAPSCSLVRKFASMFGKAQCLI